MIYNTSMVSYEAVQKILGISEDVDLSIEDMKKRIIISFLPTKRHASQVVEKFVCELNIALKELGVKVINFHDAWEYVPVTNRIRRFFKYATNNCIYMFRSILKLPQSNFWLSYKAISKLCAHRRIKKNISIICIGEQDVDDLAMQYIASFKTNSIITILDMPKDITEMSNFVDHFNASMSLFAYHMTNVVIGVSSTNWLIYNFNLSHPIYKYPDSNFKHNILHNIIPKLAAPITPHKLSDFIIEKNRFSIADQEISSGVSDMVSGAKLFSKTNLYPDGKKIDDLPFREDFHKLIGKLHLDNRSGMSFGYLSHQLPTKADIVVSLSDFRKQNPDAFETKDYYVDRHGKIYILHKIAEKLVVISVPDVWVLTLKSGADKTNFKPNSDIIKLGLVNGILKIQLPHGSDIDNTYKPSFDTKVILAHSLCNILLAGVAKYSNRISDYVEKIENEGFSTSHWHGYFNKDILPKNVLTYGRGNLPVSCSSPQSAIYAFEGKFYNIIDKIEHIDKHSGDIHIEPHHGINVSYHGIENLAKFIIDNPNSTTLGNKYL